MKNKLIIVCFLFLFMSCSSNKFTKQELVIPKSYKGEIWIFYGQEYNRGKFEKTDNKIVFYTPTDGIIFSKYVPDDIIDLVEVDETRKRIQNNGGMDNGNKKLTVGTLGTLELPDQKKITYLSYFSGDKKSVDSVYHRANDYDYIVKKYKANIEAKQR
ncbi:hypothetical protein [Sphingobacterium sp. 2149]|uniref:hypothetical protein n=1 Tax=Sphingobacterium sp. 2149 TaxID=2817763 RepID=UPI001AE6AD3B|nr:hypothetical protein [Sphingobacterium sp. 2149]MDR6735531.1 hypothetical protein [Sphingobacterium sp. 2149]